MQIHRVRGSNLKEALVRARSAHGDDALVISQEAVQGGIALAVARRSSHGGADPERRSAEGARPVLELAACLERNGASPAFVAQIVAAVEARRALGRHVVDVAADVIAEIFPAVRLARLEERTRVLAFAGASGVGKTTTILKLARKLKAAGRRIELATLDERGERSGELFAGSRELELPLTVLRPNVRLRPDAFARSAVDLVLLDTRGDLAGEREKLLRLDAVLRTAGAAFDLCLVLPATASGAALSRVRSELGTLAPATTVITKIDETRAPTAALEASLATGARISFLSDGPDLERDLHRSDGDRIADLCLRGRLA